MKLEDYDNLDAFIDAALQDEPLRDTPFGFHARFDPCFLKNSRYWRSDRG